MAGIRAWLQRLAHAVKLRRVVLLEMTGPGQINECEPRIDCRLAVVTPQNAELVRPWRGDHVAAMFHRFLDEGQCGVYAIADGQVIGHLWLDVCRQAERLANGYIRLRRGEALVHFCRVRPPCRGHAVLQAGLARACHAAFREHGVRRIVVDANVGNAPALRAFEKAGFRRFATARYVQVGHTLLCRRIRPDAAPRHTP